MRKILLHISSSLNCGIQDKKGCDIKTEYDIKDDPPSKNRTMMMDDAIPCILEKASEMGR